MRKLIALFFVASLFTMAACGKKAEETNTTDSAAMAPAEMSAPAVDSAAMMPSDSTMKADSAKAAMPAGH